MKKKIELVRVNLDNNKKTRLATFSLDGDEMISDWTKDGELTKKELERNGIVVKGVVLKPSDGKKFFDAIPIAYSQSSLVYAKVI